MQVFSSRNKLTTECRLYRAKGASIGFVPTMGALHQGHISLVKQCIKENDICVVSIFVNPTQFNQQQDLISYPRQLEKDLEMLKSAGCHVVFTPDESEMYAEKPVITFHFGHLENTMEGANRPGHFNGVGIIVSKLFNTVQPDNAYFGQKDFQQLAIINQLVEDLGYPINIHACPTAREKDGLAMSSRNQRLTDQDRGRAPVLYHTLQEAKKLIQEGVSLEQVQATLTKQMEKQGVEVEYFEIVDSKTLKSAHQISGLNSVAICVAAYFGNVRLIDNILVSIK